MKKDEDILKEAKKRFEDAVAYWSPYYDQLDQDISFALDGEQWDETVRTLREKDPGGARPTLTVNRLVQYVHNVVNNLRDNRPTIKYIPASDGAAVETAAIKNGLVRHIEAISRADHAYATAAQFAVAGSLGYIRVVTDYANDETLDQEVYIRRVTNPRAVYLDPAYMDLVGADAKWGFYVDKYTQEDFKAEFPKAKEVDWEFVKNDDPWFDNHERRIRVAEYYRVVTTYRTKHFFADGTTAFDDEIEKNDPREKVGSRQVPRRKVEWYKLTGQEILDRREVPGSYVPIIIVPGEEFWVGGERKLRSLIYHAKDTQRAMNYSRSALVELLALSPKVPYVGAEGQFAGHEDEWDQVNQTNIPYVEYKPAAIAGTVLPPPIRQSPITSHPGLVQELQMCERDLQSELGMYEANLGQKSNEQSGRAVLARKQQGELATMHFQLNLAAAIEQVGRVVLGFMDAVYDARTTARILGEDGEAQDVTLNPDQDVAYQELRNPFGQVVKRTYNLQKGTYGVDVAIGPGFQTRRQEAAAAMTDLLSTNPGVFQVIGDLAVRNMDWPGAEAIAERLRRGVPPQFLGPDDQDQDQTAQQMMQMQQQLDQANEIMQQMQMQLEQTEQQANEAVTQLQQDAQDQIKELQGYIQQLQGEVEKLQSELEQTDADYIKQSVEAAKLNLEQQKVDLKEREVAISERQAEHAASATEREESDERSGMLREQHENVSATLRDITDALQIMAEKLSEKPAPTLQNKKKKTVKFHLDQEGMPIGAEVDEEYLPVAPPVHEDANWGLNVSGG